MEFRRNFVTQWGHLNVHLLVACGRIYANKLCRFTNIEGDRLFGTHGGSGGFLEYIFRYAAKEIFDVEVKGELKYTVVRNTDYKEVFLEVCGEILANGAFARNSLCKRVNPCWILCISLYTISCAQIYVRSSRHLHFYVGNFPGERIHS